MPSRAVTTTVLALLLLMLCIPTPLHLHATVSADCQEDLAEARGELDAAREELEQVKEERDDYARRLEDSTTVLILALFLLVGSYIFFYINTRRAKIALLEYQRRMGIDPGARPPRRRRG